MAINNIYVRLLNEGTDVWRPTSGEKIAEDIYKILPTKNYHTDDEQWEFAPGTIVKCELQKKSNGKILVAVKKLEQEINARNTY